MTRVGAAGLMTFWEYRHGLVQQVMGFPRENQGHASSLINDQVFRDTDSQDRSRRKASRARRRQFRIGYDITITVCAASINDTRHGTLLVTCTTSFHQELKSVVLPLPYGVLVTAAL